MSEILHGLGLLCATVLGATAVTFGLRAGVELAHLVFGPFNITIKKVNLCATCRHWLVSDKDWPHGGITQPVDPDTYEPMEMPFEVRECQHPKLMFCERPVENPGFAVADGSTYVAKFYTTGAFGCVLHQPDAASSPREEKS